jgi:hypothetical protein
MKFQEYMRTIRPLGGLTSKEAKLAGIPYPLPHGWMGKYAGIELDDSTFAAMAAIAQAKRKSRAASAAIKAEITLNADLSTMTKSQRRKAKKQQKRLRIKAQLAEHKTAKNRPVAPVVITDRARLNLSNEYLASNEFLKSYEWRKLRLIVIKENGAQCQCCGASPSTGAVINVDHIKPRKTHPHLALDKTNLQVLCDACNHGKGNWDQTDWRKKDTDGKCMEQFSIEEVNAILNSF